MQKRDHFDLFTGFEVHRLLSGVLLEAHRLELARRVEVEEGDEGDDDE